MDMCIDMCIDMCVGMCIEVCMDMCIKSIEIWSLMCAAVTKTCR